MTKKPVLAFGSLLVVLVLATTACSGTAAPQPTYTPYPTNTPYPTQVPPTATPEPTAPQEPTEAPRTPTVQPLKVVETLMSLGFYEQASTNCPGGPCRVFNNDTLDMTIFLVSDGSLATYITMDPSYRFGDQLDAAVAILKADGVDEDGVNWVLNHKGFGSSVFNGNTITMKLDTTGANMILEIQVQPTGNNSSS